MQSDKYTCNTQCDFIHFNMNGSGGYCLDLCIILQVLEWSCYRYFNYYETMIFATSFSDLHVFPFQTVNRYAVISWRKPIILIQRSLIVYFPWSDLTSSHVCNSSTILHYHKLVSKVSIVLTAKPHFFKCMQAVVTCLTNTFILHACTFP